MRKIRILIADDAVVVRHVLTAALSSDPMLDVVGSAANGRIALAKIRQVNPDVVILDVEMPVMDGLQALAALRRTNPRLPVIMFSTLTERGGIATLEALSLGATDYVTKPGSEKGGAQAIAQRVRDELVLKIKTLCGRTVGMNLADVLPMPAKVSAGPGPGAAMRGPHPVDILAIGVSTGGPNALSALLPELPSDFPVPVVIAQHMPPMFTRLLAERLDSRLAIRVREGASGDTLAPGTVWVAPGDYHMVVVRDGRDLRLAMNQDPPQNFCRPAVDVLFRSVAETFGRRSLALVLTGMGHDGLRGCEQIHGAGGDILVQDEASSVVWGMPGFVARSGLARAVLPLDQLGAEIVRAARVGRTVPVAARISGVGNTEKRGWS